MTNILAGALLLTNAVLEIHPSGTQARWTTNVVYRQVTVETNIIRRTNDWPLGEEKRGEWIEIRNALPSPLPNR